MSSRPQTFAELIERDRRYRPEAYQFVFDALAYAQEEMGLGGPTPEGGSTGDERHLTGQQLCEAVRRLAIEQFGYMAKCVFNSWGVQRSGDFGEIVYNLIDLGKMRKTKEDRREDFDDVFDFDRDLRDDFRFGEVDD